MITVKKVGKIIIDQKVRLSCKFDDEGKEDVLWFETSLENEKHLSDDNCDSFFVIMYLYALHKKVDLRLEAPVSRKLLYGIENYLTDILIMMRPSFHKIKVYAQINENEYKEAKGIATAMSMGVDSFYTLIRNSKGYSPVSHLTLFNAGAFGSKGGEKARSLFLSIKKQAKEVARELQMPLIWVDTNLNEILSLPFIPTHTYRNIACALLFQKLFKTYFYSSGHNIKDFNLSYSDSANYDLIVALALSSNKLSFEIFGLMANRVEKTKLLVASETARKYLNVCIVTTEYDSIKMEGNQIQNCSKCYKCIRTMLTLEIIGELEKFRDVFDLNHFEENKDKFLAGVIYHYFRSRNTFSAEILREIKLQKYQIRSKTYYYLFLRSLQPINQKVKSLFLQQPN